MHTPSDSLTDTQKEILAIRARRAERAKTAAIASQPSSSRYESMRSLRARFDRLADERYGRATPKAERPTVYDETWTDEMIEQHKTMSQA